MWSYTSWYISVDMMDQLKKGNDKFFLNASFFSRKTLILNQWRSSGGNQRWHQKFFFLLILDFFARDLKRKKYFCFNEEHLHLQWMIDLQCDFICFLSLGIWNGILSHHGIGHGNIHDLFLWTQCSVLMLAVKTICCESLWKHPV